MEDELNWAAVTYRTNGLSAHDKPSDLEIIYEEVKAVERARDTNPVTPEKVKKAPLYSLLHLTAAGLGMTCIILVLVFIALSFYCITAVSGQYNLAAHNLQLRAEKADLERVTEELTRERDRLNWTIGVILEYEDFPVNSRCPQRVCKPCLDGWVLFQSKCYLFQKSTYYTKWRNWMESREKCRGTNADLVVIESQEEQKFINCHTRYYNDKEHGYWIGLSNVDLSTWTWVDGSNVTLAYWTTNEAVNRAHCVLTLSLDPPLANWNKAFCSMKNRWICEMKALIKESI